MCKADSRQVRACQAGPAWAWQGSYGKTESITQKGFHLTSPEALRHCPVLHSLTGLCQSPSACAAVGCLPTLSLGMSNATRSRGQPPALISFGVPSAGPWPVAFHFSPAGPTAGSVVGREQQQVASSMMYLGRRPTSSHGTNMLTWS